MKRIINVCCLIALICSMFSFTGCGVIDIISNSIENAKSKVVSDNNDEVAYIAISNMFYDTVNDEYDFQSGKAYESIIKEDSISADDKVYKLNTLYFNEIDFHQYVPGNSYCNCYSGSYKISLGNQLVLNYENQYQHDAESHETLQTINILDDTRSANKMIDANEGRYMLNAGLSNPYPYHDSFCFPDFSYLRQSGEWKYSFLHEGGDASVYLRDNYIVAKQKSYIIEKNTNDDCYTLISSDRYGEVVMNMYSDNTWRVTKFYNSHVTDGVNLDGDDYSGTWELYDSNILIMYPPSNLNSDYYNDNEYFYSLYSGLYSKCRFFYVDFEREQVYIPLYAKCDDVLELVHQIDNH